MSTPLPPVIVFDAYGTLLDVEAPVAAHAAAIGPDWQALAATWRAKQIEQTWILTLAERWVPFWTLTTQALDFALAAHGRGGDTALRERLIQTYAEVPALSDAADAVARAAAAGARLAVLTNAGVEMVERALQAAGLRAPLEVVLSAEAVERYKPHASVYRLATRHFGRLAPEIGFVSANAWDAAGASAYGFRVAHINRRGLPAEYPDMPPAHRVNSLGAAVAGLLADDPTLRARA